MLKRAKCGKTLPLLAAVESKESWQDVLSIYFKTCSHLKNVYTPTNKELLHGLSKMPSSWSTSLFYYEIIKKGCGIERPDRKIVLEVLHRYKVLHNFNGIQRILNEDVSSEGLEGAQSALLLASYTNMWEKSLEIVARHPSILASSTNRRSVINTLCNAGHWEKALRVLRANGRDLPPGMIRPIVKRLSLEQNHQRALELVALSFAQGYTLSPNLLSGLLFTLRETNHWETALELAHAQGFFSLPRSAAKKSVSTLNQLIQCLYESDPYYQFTTEEIFNDIVSRSNPKDVVYRSSTKKKQFRCLSPSEISGKYNGILSCIAHQYAKVASIPRWYSKGVSSIVSSQYADTLYVIIDTNILIQCASKNLPLEHFYHHIKKSIRVLKSTR
ncbi:hypothetical protein AGDE_09715 [Angomonas deanei]|uniref:Uncharacterized protein n=1 Tax=Angomonas deanei TaxID=59799 RepID=A0A7G2CAL7_9TRYP|nr:hypothetical protein AGDE_09715 [Angomonas deanei]CAD2215947.1 hypothetical protein, conserved [Angomonas deanei]|eukprot:EPY29896.1 hypothetical protein AGDE_09715 [Angomonas deanei]